MDNLPVLLDKNRFWAIIVDYYFDEVHWDSGKPKGIHKWLESEFGAVTAADSNYLSFNDSSKANWFLLRWS